MIRKIVLLSTLVFISCWFGGAYFIKEKVTFLVKKLESDNIKIGYEDVKIFGFPNLWQIKFVAPKVKLIGHTDSTEIASKELIFCFDATLQQATLTFGNDVKQEQNFNDRKIEYYFHSDDSMKVILRFAKPLYLIVNADSFTTILKSLIFNNKLLSIIYLEHKVFDISNLEVAINKNIVESATNIATKFHAEYEGGNNFLNFNLAQLDFNGIFTVGKLIAADEDAELLHYKALKINNLIFAADNAKVDLTGSWNQIKGKVPQGKFMVNLINYNDLVEKLTPNNFITLKPLLKKMIAKAANPFSLETQNSNLLEDINEDAKFDIEFSDSGVKIGLVKLEDFKNMD